MNYLNLTRNQFWDRKFYLDTVLSGIFIQWIAILTEVMELFKSWASESIIFAPPHYSIKIENFAKFSRKVVVKISFHSKNPKN